MTDWRFVQTLALCRTGRPLRYGSRMTSDSNSVCRVGRSPYDAGNDRRPADERDQFFGGKDDEKIEQCLGLLFLRHMKSVSPGSEIRTGWTVTAGT